MAAKRRHGEAFLGALSPSRQLRLEAVAHIDMFFFLTAAASTYLAANPCESGVVMELIRQFTIAFNHDLLRSLNRFHVGNAHRYQSENGRLFFRYEGSASVNADITAEGSVRFDLVSVRLAPTLASPLQRQ